jgi:hypothetical protein
VSVAPLRGGDTGNPIEGKFDNGNDDPLLLLVLYIAGFCFSLTHVHTCTLTLRLKFEGMGLRLSASSVVYITG